ncbi:MAG: ribosome recycling factor [Chloroflexota bacterium]|nr:ribosome recycling factor [Chloroflexota bacterium]
MSDAQGQSVEAHMSEAVEAMDRDFNHIRTGRASTALVERIQVDYYGAITPLNQLASISVPESTTVVIQPWDRGVLGAIEKAIQKSDIGITPNTDGTVVRLNIPPLTEERRKELVKLVHKRMEEAKVEIRNHRREGVDTIRKQEKSGEVGADEARRQQEALEKLTHKWTDEVDRVGAAKEAEVLEV